MDQILKEIELTGKNSKHIFKALRPPKRELLPNESFMYITTYYTQPEVYNMDAVKIYTSEIELVADIQQHWQNIFFYKVIGSEEDGESIKVDLILGNPEHDIGKPKFK